MGLSFRGRGWIMNFMLIAWKRRVHDGPREYNEHYDQIIRA